MTGTRQTTTSTGPDLETLARSVAMSPFATCALDPTMRVTCANDPLRTLTGRTDDELVGQRLADLLAWRESDTAALNRREGRPVPVTIASAQLGGGWRTVSFVPTGVDSSETEQHLRRLSAQHDFVAMISHELRTPVAAVLGFAELLQRPADLEPGTQAEVLEALVRNARRQVRIIDQLLDASALAEGAIQVVTSCVPVTDVVDRALAEVPLLGERARVDLPDGLRVVADAFRLQQVLVSFLTNAVKYGGPDVVITAEVAQHQVHVTVTDDGPGVPLSFQPDLFEMFTQAGHPIRRTARGTGLGLHLARGMAVAMGGAVTFAPATPQGATFGVRLPSC